MHDRLDDTIGSAEPLIAGTLALMTFYADKPSVAARQKIGRNLQTLQHHSGISAELSVVCRRLAAYWLTLGCEVQAGDAHTACRFAAASAALQ
ncbi:MAG: hypothetical protein AB7S55_05180 [Thiomonas sp.]